MAAEASLAKKISDKARHQAVRDLTDMYPDEYIRLRESNNRHEALRLLRNRHPGQWRVLLVGWRRHFQEMLGWTDGRL